MRLRFLYLILLVATLPLHAQKKKAATLPTDPLTSLEPFINAQLTEFNVPGCGVAVIYKDKVILSKGFGYRDVATKQPVTDQTLFAIGSCSKAFTATTLGILVDRGLIDFNKPVRNYLPEFTLSDEYVSNHMAVKDLLCHNSGLPRHDFMWYGSPFSRKELFSRLSYLKPNKAFREAWQYNNLMFMTAGILAEKVGGQPWEDLVQTELFGPLGMKNTSPRFEAFAKGNEVALGYQQVKNVVTPIPYKNIDAIGPAGSIVSSASEMANWVRLNLNNGKLGGKELVAPTTMRQIHSPLMVVPGPQVYDEVSTSTYGMGWFIASYRGHTRVSHGGNIDGFSALVSMLPRDSIGIVVLTNMNNTALPTIIASRVQDLLLGLTPVDWSKRQQEAIAKAKLAAAKKQADDDKSRVKGTTPSHPLTAYIGQFENPGYGTITIESAGDSLKANFNGLTLPIHHYHYDLFETAGALEEGLDHIKFTFVTDGKGDIGDVVIPIPSSDTDIMFSRKPDAKLSDVTQLQRLVGDYTLSGVTVVVGLRGGKTLTVTVPGQPTYELVPTKPNLFDFKELKGYSVQFTTDDSPAGKVKSMTFLQPNGNFVAARK